MEQTHSATAPLFHLPGWYWYLKDEKDFRELPNAENFLEVCLRVISDKFRIMGFTELLITVSKLLHNTITPDENKLNYAPYLKYIYNRHPFIQMTSKPLSTASVHVTIPLKRLPSHEIQLDDIIFESSLF